MKPNSQDPARWWPMYLHNACYALMGCVLLLSFHESLLVGGLLLLAGGSTLTLGMRRRRAGETDNLWFIVSSVRDLLFGVFLLIPFDNSDWALRNGLGLWAIIYAFLQAIEANFYFLGTRNNQDKDYAVEIIHFVCVFIAGGFAYVLIMHPGSRAASPDLVGLFLVGLGLAQQLLTRRLQRDAEQSV